VSERGNVRENMSGWADMSRGVPVSRIELWAYTF